MLGQRLPGRRRGARRAPRWTCWSGPRRCWSPPTRRATRAVVAAAVPRRRHPAHRAAGRTAPRSRPTCPRTRPPRLGAGRRRDREPAGAAGAGRRAHAVNRTRPPTPLHPRDPTSHRHPPHALSQLPCRPSCSTWTARSWTPRGCGGRRWSRWPRARAPLTEADQPEVLGRPVEHTAAWLGRGPPGAEAGDGRRRTAPGVRGPGPHRHRAPPRRARLLGALRREGVPTALVTASPRAVADTVARGPRRRTLRRLRRRRGHRAHQARPRSLPRRLPRASASTRPRAWPSRTPRRASRPPRPRGVPCSPYPRSRRSTPYPDAPS